MNSVLDNDKETIDDGKLIMDSINRGQGSFSADIMFESLTKNYSLTNKLYGETILRKVTGYGADYLKKNIGIPEFRKELKNRIEENIDRLKKEDLLDSNNKISKKGYNLASLILYTQELDNLVAKGVIGKKANEKYEHYGDKHDIKNFHKGSRYRDISIRKTIKTVIKRNHKKIEIDDIKLHKRKSKGMIYVVYCIDSSGSMNGKKIEMAKKAGIALAFKATEEKDKVGLIVFGTEVTDRVSPTRDFWHLLKEITRVRTGKETNIRKTIEEAITMFPNDNVTKHIVILSDAMPNVGKAPERETIEIAAKAASHGITISLIGIDLDEAGENLAKKIVEAGNGKLYMCNQPSGLDTVILEDYYNL